MKDKFFTEEEKQIIQSTLAFEELDTKDEISGAAFRGDQVQVERLINKINIIGDIYKKLNKE